MKSEVNQKAPPEYLASANQSSFSIAGEEKVAISFENSDIRTITLPIKKKVKSKEGYKIPLKRKFNRLKTTDVATHSSNRKTDPLGLTAFGLGIVGALGLIAAFYAGAGGLLAILAILGGGIMGLISVKKIKKEPEKWKGKGFGIFAQVLFWSMMVFFVLYFIALLGTV
ncbi:hypothetical protein [Reichenbachiella sp.]|uniref:hypothetical protein n=1 Tax=Reichenbachiella sp. TaxID=2184521 RepID=UPI003BB057D4